MKAKDPKKSIVIMQTDFEEKNILQGYTANILSVTSNFPAKKWMMEMKRLEEKMKKITNKV